MARDKPHNAKENKGKTKGDKNQIKRGEKTIKY
jgi:hypothetical protein